MPIAKSSNRYAAKERVKLLVGEHPALFYTLNRLKRKNRTLAINRYTELVIEGFPRSANTFAVVAFEYAQPHKVRIAHHLHSPAQIVRAAEWNIPAVVLIRSPRDAVISFVIREPNVSVETALRGYISFYETITGYRSSFVLAPFEEVTTDYGYVIERINEVFHTEFWSFEHSGENVERVFSSIEELNRSHGRGKLDEARIARPSIDRTELKEVLEMQWERKSAKALLRRAEKAYRELLSSHAGCPEK